MWGAKAGVQVSRRELHTHIHLDYARVEFYLVLKKKKKIIGRKVLLSYYILSNVIDTNYFTTFLQTADVTLVFSK